MKVDESGMPEEDYWNSLFDIPRIVDWLNIERVAYPIVDCGCGYGTFTIPIAKKTTNLIYAIDMEPSVIDTARKRALAMNIHNIEFHLRDFIQGGTGLEPNSVGMVLLFNILHCAGKRVVLEEAMRILRPSGVIAILHWRKDIQTPRGPSFHVRPDEEAVLSASDGLGLYSRGESKVLEPYHWGMQLVKGIQNEHRNSHRDK